MRLPLPTPWQDKKQFARLGVVLGLALGLHGLGVMWLRTPGASVSPDPGTRSPLAIRWLPVPAPVPVAVAARSKPPLTPAASMHTSPSAPSPTRTVRPARAPSPATQAPPADATPASSATTPSPVAAPSTDRPPPLDLRYAGRGASPAAPPSLVEQARGDPRANSALGREERTLQEQMRASSNGRTEERMAEGHRVRARGHCYRIHDNPSTAINPFNQSTAPAARGVESCD